MRARDALPNRLLMEMTRQRDEQRRRADHLAHLLRTFHNPEFCRYPSVPCSVCEALK